MRLKVTHTIKPIIQQDCGDTHEVSIRIPMEKGWIDNVKFYIWKENWQQEIEMNYDEEASDETHACFKTQADLTSCQLDHYYFSYEAEGKLEHYLHGKAPDWAEGAVAYQIFPDRFNRSNRTKKIPMERRRIHQYWYEKPSIGPDEQGIYNNDFFGGDSEGVIEKMGYISSLGVEILYFNPFFRSQSTHRYDTGDYMHADPYFGTDEEVHKMAQVAHENGLKNLLDGVFNHTGNDSIYYNEYGTYNTIGAAQSENSEYRDFYKWGENGEPSYWWGIKTLPVCDKENPRYRDFIFGPKGVIDRWKNVADGWRFDVIDELPEDFVEGCAQAMQRVKPNNYLFVGEVWEDAEGKEHKHLRHGCHTVMNYLYTNPLIKYYKYGNILDLYNALGVILTKYPLGTRLTLMNSTSTHDGSRLIEILGCDVFDPNGENGFSIDWVRLWYQLPEHERNNRIWRYQSEERAIEEFKIEWQRNHKMTLEEYERGKRIMKSYLTALAFVPGIFTINYGDEVGMQGIGNLLNRGPYPWGHEDFEILQLYKDLIRSRQSEEFLRKADMRVLKISNEHFVFERYDDNNKAIVITSRVNYKTKTAVPEEYQNAKVVFCTQGSNQKMLTSYGAIVLKK